MYGRFFLRALVVLLVIGAVVGIGVYGYNLGVAQSAPAGAAQAAPGPYFYPHPFFPFWGFGCFGLLIPLFFLLLIFGGLRMLFWRGRWGHMHGPWREGWEKGVPPMFEEWHKRAHEPKADAPGEPKPEGKDAR